MGKAIDTCRDNLGYFNPPNVYRPAIIDIRIVGEYSAEDGATNTYRITQNDGKIFEFDVKNGSGGSAGRSVTSVEQIQISTESLGKNIARINLSDGTYTDVEIRNGAQGQTGPQGERGPAGIDSVEASIGTNDPTQAPSVEKELSEGVLSLTFNNIKGAKGNQGEPAVAVENYVTVEATSSTTSATDVLPATGSADTVYRVSNWDGTQYDANAYTEYGWYDGAYKMLATRTPGIDDEPTAGSQKLVKSGGVAAQISQLGQDVENPEWVKVVTDSEDRILYGVKTDGKFYFGDGCPPQVVEYIQNIIEGLSLDEYENIVSFLGNLIDGDTLSTLLNAKVDKVIGKSLIDSEFASSQGVATNPEYLQVTTDSEDKIVEGIKTDGTKVIECDLVVNGKIFNGNATEEQGIETTKISIDGNIIENIEDPEGRIDIQTDSEGKIISYRDSDGVKHEEVGVETDKIILSKDGASGLKKQLDEVPIKKYWYLPKFGKVNIKEETFYLTADQRWSAKNDVVCIQMLDDTDANARQRLTISHYYIKSTLTPLPDGGYDRTSVNADSVKLQLFPAKDVVESNGRYFVKKITKVGGEWYLTSSLAETATGYDINYIYGQANSMKVDYTDASSDQTTLVNAIEVTQVKDVPPYRAWFVSKELEHYCVADIDFGHFYGKTNVPVGIKYQGSGTTAYRKRGLRLTFYKANNYSKKDKVKIGEMVRLSGYNMKAFPNDTTRVKDPVFSNLFIEMWEDRGKDCYPWNKYNYQYNGATGFIKSFPIELSFGEEFYGLHLFGLKKDEKNYLLDGDDDTSGIFVSGANGKGFALATHADFEDEMMDDMSQETITALDELCKYTKGFVDGTIVIDGETVDFTNDMLEEHIDLASWIDYWIGLEVLMLYDNDFHNIILYSGADKKKFYLFFYDLDNSADIVAATYTSYLDYMENVYRTPVHMAFWRKFTTEYKDYIINRYSELRKSILTVENINSIYKSYVAQIPANVISAENAKWGVESIDSFDNILEVLKTRLEYLDNNYFNVS